MESKTQTYCVRGSKMSNTNDIIKYEKRNPLSGKIVKCRKGNCDMCGCSKSQTFTK